MSTAKQRIKKAADERRRSAFRDEFYKDSQAQRRAGGRGNAGGNAARRGGQRFPLWVTLSGLGVLLCMIAVGGSSAMIWLRRLGEVFDVHWVGD